MPDNPITFTQIRASATIVGAQRQNPGCTALTDAVGAALRRLREEGLGYKKIAGGDWCAGGNHAG